jgi:hypothetical protein
MTERYSSGDMPFEAQVSRMSLDEPGTAVRHRYSGGSYAGKARA